MSRIILCACEKEAQLLKDFQNVYVVGTNTQALSNIFELVKKGLINLEDDILNFGFAGSFSYDVDRIFSIDRVLKNATFSPLTKIKPISNIQRCDCITCDEFQEEYKPYFKNAVVDMELYYVAQIFKNLYSLKVVSDNLCEKSFDGYFGKDIKNEICKIVSAWIND